MSIQRIISADIISGISTSPNVNKNANAEKSLAGYATFADGASLVDGIGGSPTATLTLTSTAPLNGTQSFLYTPGATGNGWSYDFSIDTQWQGRVMQIQMFYQVGGTGYDNSGQIWIYDITNSKLIQPAPYVLQNSGIVDRTQPMSFQTAINSTSYRLIYFQSTSTSTYTIKFDNVIVEPVKTTTGGVTTNWQAYTPVFTNFGTVATPAFEWRRIGDSVEVRGAFACGTTVAAEARVQLPNAVVIGGSLGNVGALTCGTWTISVNTSAANFQTLGQYGNNYITFAFTDAAHNGFQSENGATIASSGNIIALHALVPIQGWGTTQVLSDQADTRVVAASKTGNNAVTGTITGSATIAKFSGTTTDTHNGYSTSTGQYTVAVPGPYRVSFTTEMTANVTVNQAFYASIAKNGTVAFAQAHFANATQTGQACAITVTGQTYFNAGDTIDFRGACSGTSPTYTTALVGSSFSLERVTGPAQVAASEKVFARYYCTGQTITTGTVTVLNYDTKITDTHGVVTPGASWNWKAPRAGQVTVSAKLLYTSAASGAAGATYEMQLFKNGSFEAELHHYVHPTTTFTNYMFQGGVAVVDVNAGDAIDVRAFQASGASRSITTGAAQYSFITLSMS